MTPEEKKVQADEALAKMGRVSALAIAGDGPLCQWIKDGPAFRCKVCGRLVPGRFAEAIEAGTLKVRCSGTWTPPRPCKGCGK